MSGVETSVEAVSFGEPVAKSERVPQGHANGGVVVILGEGWFDGPGVICGSGEGDEIFAACLKGSELDVGAGDGDKTMVEAALTHLGFSLRDAPDRRYKSHRGACRREVKREDAEERGDFNINSQVEKLE